MKSRLITLSEKGLNLDTLNNNKMIKSKMYFRRGSNLLYKTEEHVVQYDLETDSEIFRYNIKDVKLIKMCICGCHAFALDYSKKMYVLQNGNITKELINIDRADINCECIITMKNTTLNIEGRTNNSFKAVKDFILSGNVLFYSSLKKGEIEKQKIIYFNIKNNETKTFEFENVENFNVKSDNSNKSFLLGVTTEYSTGSYFGTMKLFFYDSIKNIMKEISIEQPLLFYDFVNTGVVLCYGPQPSKVVIMDFNMITKKQFNDGVRNRVYFNIHDNLVGFAGFGNLSGDIEIYGNKLLCKLKVLGASIFSWSPCGSYFMVAITNELKVDNKIVIYDYFGNLINEIKYDNLETCEWIGDKEEFKKIKEPLKLNIYKEEQYIPPHLRNKSENNNKIFINKNIAKNKKISKKNETVMKKEENLEELNKKIAEIDLLKSYIKEGKTLEMEDFNKILKEDEIKTKIENIKKNK